MSKVTFSVSAFCASCSLKKNKNYPILCAKDFFLFAMVSKELISIIFFYTSIEAKFKTGILTTS